MLLLRNIMPILTGVTVKRMLLSKSFVFVVTVVLLPLCSLKSQLTGPGARETKAPANDLSVILETVTDVLRLRVWAMLSDAHSLLQLIVVNSI